MHPLFLSRRNVLKAAAVSTGATVLLPPAAHARPDTGVSAYPFPLTAVRLQAGPFADNAGRTLAYLTFLDPDRLLHMFRVTAGLVQRGLSDRPAGAVPEGERVPVGLPGKLHRPGGDRAAGVGALLHAAQDRAGPAGHASAGRQRPGADRAAAQSGLGAGAEQPADVRATPADAARRVRRHRRDAVRPVPAEREPGAPDHRAVLRPRPGARPARRRHRCPGRFPRQYPDSQGARRHPRLPRHRHHQVPRHRVHLLELRHPSAFVRDRRQLQRRVLPSACRPGSSPGPDRSPSPLGSGSTRPGRGPGCSTSGRTCS